MEPLFVVDLIEEGRQVRHTQAVRRRCWPNSNTPALEFVELVGGPGPDLSIFLLPIPRPKGRASRAGLRRTSVTSEG